MAQISEIRGRLLHLKLDVRRLTGVSVKAGMHGVAESRALAAAAENVWRLLDAFHAKANFNPNQPRVPAGNPDGGQWTSEQPNGGGTRVAGQEERPPSRSQGSVIDRMNEQAYQRIFAILEAAGHHLIPLAVIHKLGIPADTARVLGDTTGKLLPPHHRWSAEHAKYNPEVEKVVIDFARAKGKLPHQLTPDEGRQLMREVWHSKNPVIRQFNLKIFRAEIVRQIARRGGRR